MAHYRNITAGVLRNELRGVDLYSARKASKIQDRLFLEKAAEELVLLLALLGASVINHSMIVLMIGYAAIALVASGNGIAGYLYRRRRHNLRSTRAAARISVICHTRCGSGLRVLFDRDALRRDGVPERDIWRIRDQIGHSYLHQEKGDIRLPIILTYPSGDSADNTGLAHIYS